MCVTMTAFPTLLYGDRRSRASEKLEYVTAIFGNLGFLYDLRTGMLHVRVLCSLKGKSDAP